MQPRVTQLKVFVVLALLVKQSLGIACNIESNCRCSTSEGSFDFSGLGTISTTNGDYNYNYNCNGVQCNGEFGSCGSSGQCSACQVATDGTFEYGLGQVTPSSIDVQPPSSGNDWVVFIGYTSGNDGRQFDIEFRFSNTPATMTYDGENPSKDYHLLASAPFGIPGISPVVEEYVDVAGIPGIIILVLLIVAVATYVIVGCLVNAFARQKRGIEIIPNLEFWKDFPFLLKDGIVFTFTFPCQKYKERRQGYESM